MLTTGNSIDPADLSLREVVAIGSTDGPDAHGATLGDIERELIVNALRKVHGNVTLAAKSLGVSRDTLRYRMDKHALRREEFV
jgi:DNA-binding NtrC family response regulator